MDYILNIKLKHLFIFILILACILVWQTQLKLKEEAIFEKENSGIFSEIEEFYDVDGQDTSRDKPGRFTEVEDGTYHDFEVDRVIAPLTGAGRHAEEKNLPIVLWWTPFTGEQGKLKRCFVGDCFFTVNRSYTDKSNAFLFYGTDFDPDDFPLPRKAHHEWGLLHEESPKNTALFSHAPTLELFNHTSTFRQQSSYPITTQYVMSLPYLTKPLKYSVAEKDAMKKDRSLASIAYIQSGCNPPSDRDAYVQELMKYVRVDSYGQCLHNKELPSQIQNPEKMHSRSFLDFLAQYKFILSFENAICDDYLTEKLFRTLSVGAVPIYKGAPNVREWLPSNKSAIIVDDLKSAKDLAEYINYIDRNPSEYEEFLSYKKRVTNEKLLHRLSTREWGVNTHLKMSFITGFECHVCDRIHSNRLSSNKLHYQVSLEHYGCPRPKKYDLPGVSGIEEWERDFWRREYDNAVQKSELLYQKVTNMTRR